LSVILLLANGYKLIGCILFMSEMRHADRYRAELIVGPDGRIIDRSQPAGFVGIFGDADTLRNASDMRSYTSALSMLPADVCAAISQIYESASSGEHPYSEFAFDIANGGGKYHHVHAYAKRTEAGNVIVGFEDETDVTKGKRDAEDGVDARNLAIAQISHDIRGPIVTAHAFVKRAARKMREGNYPNAAESLSNAAESLAKAEGRFDLSVEMAKRLAGGDAFDIRLLNIYGAIEPALELVAPEAAGRHVTIDFNSSLEPGILAVRGDKYQLESLYLNLFSNAIRHAQKRITYGAEAHRERGEYEFNVYNDGPPMPAELAKTIFSPESQPSKTMNGHGAGFWICRNIVPQLGGRIWVAERAEGTDIRFTLPMPTDEEIAQFLESQSNEKGQ